MGNVLCCDCVLGDHKFDQTLSETPLAINVLDMAPYVSYKNGTRTKRPIYSLTSNLVQVFVLAGGKINEVVNLLC